jgi:RND family efflux transporter MFP subunit
MRPNTLIAPTRKWVPLLRGARLAYLSLLSIALIASGAGAGCSKKGDDETSKSESSVAQVTLTEVTRADVSRILQLTGSVGAVPNRDVKVSSFVPGRIADLNVAEGDKVAAGQVLAKIDDRPIRDQLAQAEAGQSLAQANVDNAKLNLARNQELFQRGISARKELEDARTELSVAEANLRQAIAAVSLAQLQLTRTEIHSPLGGTVVKRFVSIGEQVDGTAATPVVEVASLGEVELLANVPASDLNRLPVGFAVHMTSASMAGKQYLGHVTGVSQAVDPVTNAGIVRIRIPNGGGELRLGMFLAAQVPVETHSKALTVPPQAIYRDERGQSRVFIVTGDTAAATPVKLGFESPERAELLSGVKEGDKVILSGGYGLTDKAKVNVESAKDQPDKDEKKDDKPDKDKKEK